MRKVTVTVNTTIKNNTTKDADKNSAPKYYELGHKASAERAATEKACAQCAKLPILRPGMYIQLRTGIKVNGFNVKHLCQLSCGRALCMRRTPTGCFAACGIIHTGKLINEFAAVYSSAVIRDNMGLEEDAISVALLWKAPRVKRVTMNDLMQLYGCPVEIVK